MIGGSGNCGDCVVVSGDWFSLGVYVSSYYVQAVDCSFVFLGVPLGLGGVSSIGAAAVASTTAADLSKVSTTREFFFFGCGGNQIA